MPFTREQLLNDLESLLTKVSQQLAEIGPRQPGCNACATCFTCCTARGLTQHRVTEMEFALIEERRGHPLTQNFRSYIERVKDERGHLRFERCPNYDEAQKGCGIYQQRPFACRVFGHLRPEGTSFPGGCTFAGYERTFAVSEYYQAVPGARQLRELTREFELYSTPVAAHYVDLDGLPSKAPDLGLLQSDDPVDQSMLLQAEGRLPEALDCLLQARGQGQSLHLDYCLACLLSQMQDHEPALAVYSHLLVHLPQRHDLRYYAGFHALFCGQPERAKIYFLETVEHLPQHSLALGFLGYLALQESHWEVAQDFLKRAVLADPNNPYFAKRLAAVQQTLRNNQADLTVDTEMRLQTA